MRSSRAIRRYTAVGIQKHTSGDNVTTTLFSPKDRHRPDALQFKAWIPRQLRAEFAEVCASQDMTASAVLRGLLVAYIQKARQHD